MKENGVLLDSVCEEVVLSLLKHLLKLFWRRRMMQKIRARTSSRHMHSSINNGVIAVYFRAKQSLQKCILSKSSRGETSGRALYESFQSVESRTWCNFVITELKSQPWRQIKTQICLHISWDVFLLLWLSKSDVEWKEVGNGGKIKKKQLHIGIWCNENIVMHLLLMYDYFFVFVCLVLDTNQKTSNKKKYILWALLLSNFYG